jgi:hypothetical protein
MKANVLLFYEGGRGKELKKKESLWYTKRAFTKFIDSIANTDRRDDLEKEKELNELR